MLVPEGETAGFAGYPLETAHPQQYPLMIMTEPFTGVDLDALVTQLLKDGPDQVSRPPELPEGDFEQIKQLMKEVIAPFPDSAASGQLAVVHQPDVIEYVRVSIMEFITNRDYESAGNWNTPRK